MPYTFKNRHKRAGHYGDHGTDFGATSESDYEQKADAFLRCALTVDHHERVRANGDTVRFNIVTDEFAILSNDGFIRTYYKPDPGIHGEGTNYDYYLRV